MDSINLKILKFLYEHSKPSEHIEIIDFIKSLGLNDNETKNTLTHLQDSLHYAVFDGYNTLPNAGNYTWTWVSLGVSNPHYGLQTLSSMTSLTGRITSEGIKFIEELQHKEKTVSLQSDSNIIATRALSKSDTAIIVAIIAMIISFVSLAWDMCHSH